MLLFLGLTASSVTVNGNLYVADASGCVTVANKDDLAALLAAGYVGAGAAPTRQPRPMEVFGPRNGANVTFYIAAAPNLQNFQFFKNGDLQEQGVDYTILGNCITTTIAPAQTDSFKAMGVV